MTDQTYFIDAGPCLNFFALGHQEILFRVVRDSLHVPQAVHDEVKRKSEQKAALAKAYPAWTRCEDRITIVPGDRNGRIDRLSRVLTNAILPDLPSKQKDLGETFVVINGLERALDGENVRVIIDDKSGRLLVGTAQTMLNAQGNKGGTLQLVTTALILGSQAKTDLIPTRGDMRRIYEQMRAIDIGLEHIDTTTLLKGNPRWKGPLRTP